MGSERASSVRQRYAGKICCECGRALPPPHRRGERLCHSCAGVGPRRVFLKFKFMHGWLCQFFNEDLTTALPRTVVLPDDKKLFEMLKRGGFTSHEARAKASDTSPGPEEKASGLVACEPASVA